MRIFGVLAFMFTSVAVSAESLPQTLRRPLIVGASVSADQGTKSPGKILALRFTEPLNIKTVAAGGTPGVSQWKKITNAHLLEASVILGVDLFFWDAVLPSTDASLETLKRVVAAADSRGLPLVLGDIPDLLPGRQKGRETLNRAIHAACVARKNCYLFPLDRLHQKVKQDGYLEIRGVKHPLKSLLPDGLHLAPTASEYLADLLEDILKAAQP